MPFERALPLPWEEGWGAGKLVLASDLAGGYNPRQFRPGQHPVEGGPLRKTAVLVAAPLDLPKEAIELFFRQSADDIARVARRYFVSSNRVIATTRSDPGKASPP